MLQGVNEDVELDEVDDKPSTIHLVARESGNQSVIGTARVFPYKHSSSEEEGWGKIGRLAVLPRARGMGVGSRLLWAAEHHALSAGMRTLLLHAQVQTQPFYERAGYKVCSGEFLEDGIRHVAMQKLLT
jgi:predicted GNAT family N-acyltransferase